MNETTNEIAQSVLARWSAAFGEADTEALVSMYTPDALFYGSTPALLRGHAGVRSYFEALPPLAMRRVEFVNLAAAAAGADAINVASVGVFTVAVDQHIRIRMTHTLGRSGGGWLIASHHASPETA